MSGVQEMVAPLLDGRNLSLARGGRTLLDAVDFSLRAGELVAILGPNGAGKSTLLALLSGVVRPDAGALRFAGRSLTAWSLAALARRRAFLAQSTEAVFNLSAWDVVSLGRAPHAGCVSPARDEAVIAAALAETRTEHLAERNLQSLSGGERQRVQLARCLAQIWEASEDADGKARLLVLDEPVSSLDPAQQHGVLASARRFAQRGVGVIAVLHDLNLAATYCDRCLLMAGGRVVGDGAPGAVMTPERLEAVYRHPFQVIARSDLGCPLVLARPLGAAV